ncbi:MAG: helix-turn-helix transcriptional regulator [Pseudonocardiaceae bacterium]
MRAHLGAQLAAYRTAAVISQTQLGQALGRTRHTVSKIEHGTRTMSAGLWAIADQLCGAEGALIAEHEVLAQAEADYRDRSRAQRRQAQIQQAGAQAQRQVPPVVVVSWPDVLPRNTGDGWSDGVLASAGLGEELRQVVTQLMQILGRRDAIRTLRLVLAAVGLSGLDLDECTRLAQAVACPSRVDARTVNNLAVTLAHCKRLEDSLGPCQVLDTVTALHRLVHRLLDGDPPAHVRKALSLVDSNIACSMGGYLVDMGQLDQSSRYFAHARKAAHDAGNTVYAAYAAAKTSFVAFERADTPTALDAAAAARSLAARTGDPRLKAFAEQVAAASYALDGQYGLCMTAYDRAHDMLATANGSVSESPAYWVHHASIDGQRGRMLTRLDKLQQALDAAHSALAHYNPTYIGRYTLCQLRLGHTLVLSREISEATRVLAEAANQAHLYPRLTAELHTTRTLLQPWANTHAVTTLDDQLHACGLFPATLSRPGNSP